MHSGAKMIWPNYFYNNRKSRHYSNEKGSKPLFTPLEPSPVDIYFQQRNTESNNDTKTFHFTREIMKIQNELKNRYWIISALSDRYKEPQSENSETGPTIVNSSTGQQMPSQAKSPGQAVPNPHNTTYFIDYEEKNLMHTNGESGGWQTAPAMQSYFTNTPIQDHGALSPNNSTWFYQGIGTHYYNQPNLFENQCNGSWAFQNQQIQIPTYHSNCNFFPPESVNQTTIPESNDFYGLSNLLYPPLCGVYSPSFLNMPRLVSDESLQEYQTSLPSNNYLPQHAYNNFIDYNTINKNNDEHWQGEGDDLKLNIMALNNSLPGGLKNNFTYEKRREQLNPKPNSTLTLMCDFLGGEVPHLDAHKPKKLTEFIFGDSSKLPKLVPPTSVNAQQEYCYQKNGQRHRRRSRRQQPQQAKNRYHKSRENLNISQQNTINLSKSYPNANTDCWQERYDIEIPSTEWTTQYQSEQFTGLYRDLFLHQKNIEKVTWQQNGIEPSNVPIVQQTGPKKAQSRHTSANFRGYHQRKNVPVDLDWTDKQVVESIHKYNGYVQEPDESNEILTLVPLLRVTVRIEELRPYKLSAAYERPILESLKKLFKEEALPENIKARLNTGQRVIAGPYFLPPQRSQLLQSRRRNYRRRNTIENKFVDDTVTIMTRVFVSYQEAPLKISYLTDKKPVQHNLGSICVLHSSPEDPNFDQSKNNINTNTVPVSTQFITTNGDISDMNAETQQFIAALQEFPSWNMDNNLQKMPTKNAVNYTLTNSITQNKCQSPVVPILSEFEKEATPKVERQEKLFVEDESSDEYLAVKEYKNRNKNRQINKRNYNAFNGNKTDKFPLYLSFLQPNTQRKLPSNLAIPLPDIEKQNINEDIPHRKNHECYSEHIEINNENNDAENILKYAQQFASGPADNINIIGQRLSQALLNAKYNDVAAGLKAPKDLAAVVKGIRNAFAYSKYLEARIPHHGGTVSEDGCNQRVTPIECNGPSVSPRSLPP